MADQAEKFRPIVYTAPAFYRAAFEMGYAAAISVVYAAPAFYLRFVSIKQRVFAAAKACRAGPICVLYDLISATQIYRLAPGKILPLKKSFRLLDARLVLRGIYGVWHRALLKILCGRVKFYAASNGSRFLNFMRTE